MPSSATALISRAIGRGLAASAKAEGFRKSGNNWARTVSGGVVQAASVQGSQANTTGSAKFTLNLGVYLPDLVEVLDRRPVALPKERDGQLRTRIGPLIGSGDHWWTVTSEPDADVAGDELAAAWGDYAVGWLNDVSTTNGAMRWLQSTDFAFHGPVIGAALALVEGDKALARTIVAAHREEMSPSRVAWALDHGLI